MFGLFAPRPPLEVQEQAWVERNLNRLARRLGPKRLGLAGGEPVEQLRPSAELAGLSDAEDGDRLFARITGCLSPAPVTPSIAWYDGDAHLSTDQTAIPLPRGGLSDPPLLAAALVRGACRRMHFDEGETDLREVDLVATTLGAGLFLANAESPAEATAASPQSGLTSREIGYALALLWHARQSADGSTGDPPWLDELRGDAAAAVVGGLKYLRKTGGALFTAETAAGEPAPPTEKAIREALHDRRRPACRLAATWDAAQLPGRESMSPAAETMTLHLLVETLRDREPAVRAGACAAVGALCPGVEADREEWDRCLLGLVGATDDPQAPVRGAALRGLAVLPDLPTNGAAREELDRVALAAIGSRTPAVRQAAAALIVRLPAAEADGDTAPADDPFVPAVMKALIGALVRCDEGEVAERAFVLRRLHPDPVALAEERVDDEEMRHRVLDALQNDPLAAPEATPA